MATQKALPPANYALYLVLGDSESHRVLNVLLLAALGSTGSDCFLCLRPNTFAETLQQYVIWCVCVCVCVTVTAVTVGVSTTPQCEFICDGTF